MLNCRMLKESCRLKFHNFIKNGNNCELLLQKGHLTGSIKPDTELLPVHIWNSINVGPDGLEPSTHGLKVRCSTN